MGKRGQTGFGGLEVDWLWRSVVASTEETEAVGVEQTNREGWREEGGEEF